MNSHDFSSATGLKLKKFAGVVALALFAGFVFVYVTKAFHESNLKSATLALANAPPLVDAITAHTAPASLPLTLPGETAAWYESTIYARVDGYVASWSADIGDHVTKGQVLATIETPDLDAQLAAAQAKLKAAQAMVDSRQADEEFAKTTYDRWKNSPKGVVSEQEREAKKAGYDSAVAQLAEAQAQVGLDQADVDRYTALTAFKQVTAPYDGTITQRSIDIGNLVTAGSTANTSPLYHMSQDDPIRVFIDAPQAVADTIKVGTDAGIKANSLPDRVFEGKVTRTADAINPLARTMKVEIDIPNPDHALLPGMYVNANFQLPSTGMIQVPAAALMFRSGGPQVGVIDKANHINFRKVVIARDNGNTVEIGSGLTAGDRVALNVSSQIADGDAVEVHEFEDAANALAQK